MPKGVYARPSPEVRFWSHVRKTRKCWIWTASTDSDGYGQFKVNGKMLKAHRFAYGAIPAGLTIDHRCRTRACVRRSHLQPVTSKVNTLRGYGPAARNARKTHCYKGHRLAGANLYRSPHGGRRCCRTCRKADGLARRQKVKP